MRRKLSDLSARARHARMQSKRRKKGQFKERKNIMKHKDLQNRLFGFHYVAPELHPELMPNGTLIKLNVVRSCFFTENEQVSFADMYSGHHKNAMIFQNLLDLDPNLVVYNIKSELEIENDRKCNMLKNVDNPSPLHLVETEYVNQSIYASVEDLYNTESLPYNVL